MRSVIHFILVLIVASCANLGVMKQSVSAEVSKVTKKISSVFSSKDDLNLDYSKSYYNFYKKYFTGRERARFQRHMSNAYIYEPVVREIFKDYGLPEDLFFVGLIESGFNTTIRSRAGAVGHWQFMKGTAKLYGLKVDKYSDERWNIYKSTEAAAKYFQDLYNIFGSWELALCAYNSGEYRVINAIRRGNTRNYRKLVSKRLLPKETIMYVPKLVAARELYNNYGKYNLRFKKRSRFPKSQSIDMRKNFDALKLARQLGVTYSQLRYLNPDLRMRHIRVNRRRPYEVFIPQNGVKNISQVQNAYSATSHRRIVSSNSSSNYYRVRRGDNLTEIARKFGTSIYKIKKDNRLKSSNIIIGQRLRVPNNSSKTYVVRRGDNLTKIAEKFGITIRQLKNYNALNNTKIYPSQRLSIPI